MAPSAKAAPAGRAKASRKLSELTVEAVSVSRSKAAKKESEAVPPPPAAAAVASAVVPEDAQPPAPEDPWEAECAPVVALLGEARHLSGSSLGMLRAAVPHCLLRRDDPGGIAEEGAGAAEWHPFQTAVLDVIVETLHGLEATRRAAVAEKEAALAGGEAEMSAAMRALEEAKAAEAAARASKDAALETADEASRAAAAAAAALEAERERGRSLAARQQSRAAEKDDYEQAKADFWDPLARRSEEGPEEEEEARLMSMLDGEQQPAPPPGAGTAAEGPRNEAFDVLMPKFEEMEVDKALLPAVAVFMKGGERSRFARTVVAHAEAALAGHIAALTAQVEGADRETAAQTSAELAAEAVARAAAQQLEVRREESFAAQNAWIGETEKVTKAEADAEALRPGVAALAEETHILNTELSDFLASCAIFGFLRERTSKVVEYCGGGDLTDAISIKGDALSEAGAGGAGGRTAAAAGA